MKSVSVDEIPILLAAKTLSDYCRDRACHECIFDNDNCLCVLTVHSALNWFNEKGELNNV